jgi:hypothetical protein
MAFTQEVFLAVTLFLVFWVSTPVIAAAPKVLHTLSYESPVRANPDDLLMIAGVGFRPTDRVVYLAADAITTSDRHPSAIPRQSTTTDGIAPVVLLGTPPYAITVRLPEVLQKGRAYKLWVVTAQGEWSEPVSINDPRPQWITPAYVYSTADFANLGRRLRIVGRNLATESGKSVQIRLRGPDTYILESGTPGTSATDLTPLQLYVADATLPTHMTPGTYSVSVRRSDTSWIPLQGQTLEVRPDPGTVPSFTLGDAAFGRCRPNDGDDDSPCFQRALEAAERAGGGTVVVPPGTWELSSVGLPTETATDGFILAHNVNLHGAGALLSFIVRHEPASTRRPSALLTLTGHNSVKGVAFSDDARFSSVAESRPIIQLGPWLDHAPSAAGDSHLVEDIEITDNTFRRVGRAITDDSSRPVARLFITRNEFGAYTEAIGLPGGRYNPGEPFRIDDSVVRWNRFVPGSYIDLTARQGAIATGMGAAYRVDFSSNVADGASTEALQKPDDPPGFRAAFFWNMNNNIEFLLVAENRALCSGDKDGDGEAIALDGSGDRYAFNGAPVVTASGTDWIKVAGSPLPDPNGRAIPRDTYYRGHWVQVVEGPGLGQVRKIADYVEDPAGTGVTFHVVPRWDVVPAKGATRIIVGREIWQAIVLANDIEHRSPPCRKSNLTGPHGGAIVIWAPSADSVIEANQQRDSNGILFEQDYSLLAQSCSSCRNGSLIQTALEIRNNVIDGEYDWSSDCGVSGIMASFGAAPTPESPPPVVGFGVSIADNTISRADGLRGGAIDIALTSHAGPAPGNWPLVQNLLIFHNRVQDIAGTPPRANCHFGQRDRVGIRIEGTGNVRDSVVYGNQCNRVDTAMAVSEKQTTLICPSGANDECGCSEGAR